MANLEETQPITKREFSRMQNDINRLIGAVFGNGEKGMDEELRTLRRDFDTYTAEERARRKEQSDERKFYIRAVIIMLITNTLTVVGYAVYWFARYAPMIEELSRQKP